jgi:hypothetical protein
MSRKRSRGRGDAAAYSMSTFTALSVLDTIISASDEDEKIVKAMDDIQDFVFKI